MGESHYDVLGVSPLAEDVVIEGAYKALVKRYHPDLHQGDTMTATARTARINEAYRVLKDQEARALYDREQGFGSAKADPSASARARREAPPPPRQPPRTQSWTAPPEAPPPTPPASGRAKTVSAGFALLALTLMAAAASSFSEKGAPPPPSSEPVATTPTTTPSTPSPSTAVVAETAKPPRAFEASFNCDKADSAVLNLICGDEELAQADREMAARYKEQLATADPPDELRATQRQWLRNRDASVAERGILLRLYKDRLLELGSDQAIIDQLY